MSLAFLDTITPVLFGMYDGINSQPCFTFPCWSVLILNLTPLAIPHRPCSCLALTVLSGPDLPVSTKLCYFWMHQDMSTSAVPARIRHTVPLLFCKGAQCINSPCMRQLFLFIRLGMKTPKFSNFRGFLCKEMSPLINES